METKYVCRSLISPYVNFHYNWTMWSTNLHVKVCRWGEKEKEPKGNWKRARGVLQDEVCFSKPN